MQASEKACRKYREWLGGMVDAANAVVAARQQQAEAEQNVKESQEALALYVKVGIFCSFASSIMQCRSRGHTHILMHAAV